MGGMKGRSWAIIVLLVLTVVGKWEVKMASEAPSAAQCMEEKRIGLNACKSVVHGKLPTPECCERIRVTHIECVCPVITPKLAALIDLNRAISGSLKGVEGGSLVTTSVAVSPPHER